MTAETRSSPEAVGTPGSGASSRVVEFFTLKRRRAEARARAFTNGDPGFADFELGIVALRDAIQVASAHDGTDTGIVLAIAALRLLVRATAARQGIFGPKEAPSSDMTAFATSLAAWTELRSVEGDAAMSRVGDAMTSEVPESHIAKLSAAERRSLSFVMLELGKRVAAPLEEAASAVRRVTRLAWLRVAAAASLVVVPAVLGLGYATTPPNLALHAHVTLSDSDPAFGIDPKHAVDGDRTNLGFHAGSKPDTAFTIDLGAVKKLHRVDVYNRADCCQERVVPVSVEVSQDGVSYRIIDRNERIFDLWSVSMPSGTTARFVRLIHGSSTYFHLSEVEVY